MAVIAFEPPPGWRTSSRAMVDLFERIDWATTPLGARSSWSPNLKLAVSMMLASAFPMALRWGPQFTLLYNDAYRSILGDKHPWALGRPTREVWTEVWDQIAPSHQAILNAQTPSIFAEDVVLRLQRHGATWEDAHFTLGYSAIEDATAPTGIGGVLVTAVEITDRVAAQEAQRISEQRYELALSAAGAVGTWDWDILNDRVIANAKFAQLYSVDPARAARGEPVGSFLLGIHPDDRERVSAEIRQTLQGRSDFGCEYRLLQQDGTIVWVFARGRAQFDAEGRAIRLSGATVDISDRKRIEDALNENRSFLKDILRSSGEAFYAVDREGSTTLCNQAFLNLLGFGSEDEVIGRKLHDRIHHTHPDGSRYDRSECPIYVCGATGQPAHVENEYFYRLDGAALPVEYWVRPIFRGEVLQGAICTFVDITERLAAAAELARRESHERSTSQALATLNATLEQRVAEQTAERMAAEEALRQSQKMEAVGQLTGGIAHDFNNMLAVVLGSMELLRRQLAGDAPSQRFVQAAADAARRASLLIQRLLAFARQQPLQPETIDANKLVTGMSDLLRHSIGADVRLETVLVGDLWRTHADPNQLENILLNLAVNARDAMPEGGRLTIQTGNAHLDQRYAATHPGLPAGQYVLIAVTDTGTGMSAEVIERAFEPFFTTKEVGKGTGLGLSQVYGFIRQSGGHVKIHSEIGKGTTIRIYLPRLHADLADDEAAGPAQSLALGDAREVVLVVEDELAVRRFSVDALQELGYRVLEADCAATALRLLDAHPEVVLLFTDVVMPDINGAKLAEEARRRRPALKVLFTTGYTRDAVVLGGLLDPGVQMIGKPFTLDALATKIRALLE
jgi:PAS domain S-box-containing protein